MSTLTVLADIGGRGAVVGFLLPIAIVALVAYGVFELIRSREASPAPAAAAGGPSGPPPVMSSSALSILDERFARGEFCVDVDDRDFTDDLAALERERRVGTDAAAAADDCCFDGHNKIPM